MVDITGVTLNDVTNLTPAVCSTSVSTSRSTSGSTSRSTSVSTSRSTSGSTSVSTSGSTSVSASRSTSVSTSVMSDVSEPVNLYRTESDADSSPPISTAASDALSLAGLNDSPITTSLEFDLSSIGDACDVDDALSWDERSDSSTPVLPEPAESFRGDECSGK